MKPFLLILGSLFAVFLWGKMRDAASNQHGRDEYRRWRAAQDKTHIP